MTAWRTFKRCSLLEDFRGGAAFGFLVGLFAALCLLCVFAIEGCSKTGFAGAVSHDLFGNWVQVKMPEGCTPKLIAASEGSAGVAVLCEDGRLFR